MTVDMSYLMLPAMLHISKYMWLSCITYFFKFLTFLYFNFLIKATYGTQLFLLRPHMAHIFFY
jgi:hypothetical protein